MADSDKDILITPNVSQTSQPEVKFVGKDNSPMYLKVLDDNTLSFEGTEGQVFSISPTMSSGDIFSVNDISGIQSIAVNADGTVALAPVSGNVGIGTTSPAGPLHVYHTDNTGVPGITIETAGGASPSDSILRIKENHGSATWVDFTVNTFGQLEITGGASTRRQIFTADEPDTNDSGTISLNKDHYEWNTQIFGDSSTPVIFVDGTNNRMGVGTTSPGHILHVKSEATEIIAEDASSGIKTGIKSGDSAGNVGTFTNANFNIITNNTQRIGIANSGAITFNSEYTFPTSDGSANQVLQTDGSGALSFATVSSGSGAVDSIANFSNNRILTASDSDSINGEENLTYDGNTLSVKSNISQTALTNDPILLVRPIMTSSRDAALTIQGARNGSTSSNTAALILSNQDDNLSNANEFNHLGAIVGRVTDTTDNHGDMHFLTFADGATANDTMTLKGDGTIRISGNISSTSANNYNLYWPLYWQRDNMGTSNIDMRMPVGGAGTTSPNAMGMPRAGKVMAVTFHYYGGTLSTSSAKSDTWRIRKHQNGTADVATKDIVVAMDTLVLTSNANQRVKTVELSTPFDFIANDSIGFKRHSNTSNTIHEVVAVLWIHYDA